MCGIAGIYRIDRKPVDQKTLQAMVEKLKHRGPDDTGIFLRQHVGLGHSRLSIIDLSPAGHQPMQDATGNFQIVFNGEIYNFKELRSQLELLGHTFVSKTDTEVILAAYQTWGLACLDKLRGMFAFAIYDARQNEIFLARDRMGEKPLYYYHDAKKLVFASEIKAILEDATIPREIDRQGLVNYFTFGHSVAPDTMYQGIKKLLPGNYLKLKNGAVTTQAYWAISFARQEDRGKTYYRQEIQRRFEDSVAERLISDVPLGVFLSGGVDSSAVVAMMAKLGVSPIKTFSVGFNIPGQEFNELTNAKVVADYFATDHHELLLQENDLVGTLEKLVYHFDEPFGDAANFPVFYMSQFAKNQVSVALTGDGGDEIFGGYRRYAAEKNRSLLLPLSWLVPGNLGGFRKTQKLAAALPLADNLLRHTRWISFFSPAMLQQLFLKPIQANPLKMYQQYFNGASFASQADAMMYLDQKILLPDAYLEKVDKASMAVGLETRPPLLDHRLVELANTIPVKYKIRGFEGKLIFKEAMAGLLPKSVLRKKKHGFAVPTNRWFRGKLQRYLAEVLFDPKTKSRGYFNYEYIEKLYQAYQNQNQPFDSQLWLLLNFELWHRQYLDKSL